MTRIRLQLFPVLAILAACSAHAQETDLAAQRERLANERIQAEALRHAQEDAAREAAASSSGANSVAPPPAPTPAPAPASESAVPGPAAPTPPTADRAPEPSAEISRALEQLRDLGELRDAGYVTDEEFQRIKRRILDERF